jgi:dihydroxyacetone kinase
MGASVPGLQTRLLGRATAAARDLNPGSFAFVMATGIAVVAGLDVLGQRRGTAGHPLMTAILAAVAAAGWLALARNTERVLWSKGGSR